MKQEQNAIQTSNACMYEIRGSWSRVALELVTNVNMVVIPIQIDLATYYFTIISSIFWQLFTKRDPSWRCSDLHPKRQPGYHDEQYGRKVYFQKIVFPFSFND